MMRFTNGQWEFFGPVRSGVDPGPSVSPSRHLQLRHRHQARSGEPAQRQYREPDDGLVRHHLCPGWRRSRLRARQRHRFADFAGHGPRIGSGGVGYPAAAGCRRRIVRKDTLAYLDRKDFAKDIRNQFVYVAKMFNEEMHVLAPKTITSMRDLDGKTVVVDLPDSSTFVTAINVFDRLGSGRTDLPGAAAGAGHAAQGRSRRDRGDRRQAAAMAEPDQRPQFASGAGRIRQAAAGGISAFQAFSADYPGLVAEGGSVETIAAEAVLASYNWAPNSDRYRRLSLLVDTMFDKVAQLQRPPFHPKWKEMAPRATVSGWTRFKAAQEWLDRNMPCPRARPCRQPRALPPPPSARLLLHRPHLPRRTAIPCIANSWNGGPAAPRPAPTGDQAGRYLRLSDKDGPFRRAVLLLGVNGGESRRRQSGRGRASHELYRVRNEAGRSGGCAPVIAHSIKAFDVDRKVWVDTTIRRIAVCRCDRASVNRSAAFAAETHNRLIVRC